MPKLIAACVALAALSLLLPSQPSYDPMAWLVWGREIAHGGLDTSGGSSWKPLPVLFTVAFAPFSALDDSVPPALWIVVARAGALLAVGLAFRLAWRLAGRGAAGALGGLVAAAGLFVMPGWLQFSAHGSEAPWAVAFMLWAVERHLDRSRAAALVLGTLACLLRPELIPFLGLYSAWLWFAERRLPPLTVGLLVLGVVTWVVPEWIGSGNPLDGGRQARSEPVWSLSLAERPWLRALERVHVHAGPAVELLALVAVGAAVALRRWTVALLALAAASEVGLYLAMTELGFSGNPRYVVPALALLCVLAGVGVANLLQARPAVAVPALAALCLFGSSPVGDRADRVRDEARQVGHRMQMHADLADAVDQAGGARAVTAMGTATTNRAFHSRLAWELKAPIEAVESVTAHRTVFRSTRGGKVFLTGRAKVRRTLAFVGAWRVYRRERLSFPLTASLQGIHIRWPRGKKPHDRVLTR